MDTSEYHEILLYDSTVYDDWIAKYVVDDKIIVWREELAQVKLLRENQRKSMEKKFILWIRENYQIVSLKNGVRKMI